MQKQGKSATTMSVQKQGINSTWAQKVTQNFNIAENSAKTQSQASWTKVTEKAQKQSAKTTSETIYRDRQLLLVPKNAVTTVNSIVYRDIINNALKEAKIDNVLVTTVTAFRTEVSIVVTTAEENTAEDLLQHKAIWEPKLNLTQVRKNKKWHKMVLHELLTAIFNNKEGLKLLHTEVKLFNKELKLVTEPVWLSTEENRQNKAHSSAVIAFATQEEVQKALRTKIMIAEISVCTAEYTDNKPYDQCQKCQGFEHTYQKCVNQTKCQICAESHHTKTHTCQICKNEQQVCEHTVLKCANCKEAHKINSAVCETFKSVKSHSSSADSLTMNEQWVLKHTQFQT